MLPLLVVRNVLRNLRRLAPMIVIIVAVFVVMLVGNAILAASGNALYGTYARLVSGDLSVSPAAESNFTIFGSDQLLIGEYLVQPTLSGFSDLRDAAEDLPEVRATTWLVSAAANVRIGGSGVNRTVFGVDFASYPQMFPDLELVAGRVPAPGEPGIVVQENRVPADGSPQDILGQPALLAGGTGRSFTLREVPVTGVFRYPVNDALLNGVVLTDADTARALNGYTYGALEEVEISQADQAVLDADVDDLFGGDGGGGGGMATDAAGPDATDSDGGDANAGDAVDLNALLGGEDAATDGGRAGDAPGDAATVDRARQTIAGSWNFLLVSLDDRADRGAVMRHLESLGYVESDGYRVRDWYRTVGGNASLVRYLQILFNAGLIFVAVGAAIIATNALVLSVLERTGEIGTMRALGAGRGRVALMIGMETLLVVMGAAAVGILLGAGATQLVNNAEYVVDNRYIAILFGGEPVRGTVTLSLVWAHLLAAIALSAVAVVYPLKKALGVSPREAMAA